MPQKNQKRSILSKWAKSVLQRCNVDRNIFRYIEIGHFMPVSIWIIVYKVEPPKTETLRGSQKCPS